MLERLRRSPFVGRSRFRMDAELAGTRTRHVAKPFHRFLIFYRVEAELISAERLLEGHSELAGGN